MAELQNTEQKGGGGKYVTATYVCPYFEADISSVLIMRECWYCKWADFRKDKQTVLEASRCRHPLNNNGG